MATTLKQFLVLSAICVTTAGSTSFAQTQSPNPTSRTPLAASAPTVVPALVPFSGMAIDRDGRALSGETGITFLIFKDQNGGEPLFTETQTIVPDATGRYTVRLGATLSSGLPLELFSTGEARWLEVQTAGQKPQSRVLLLSVPYALKAADAATLGGLPASAFALASPGNSAALPMGVTPLAFGPNTTTTVTTTGGTANKLAKFSGTSTIVNSILFDNGTQVGVGTTSPTATLTVGGTSTLNGASTLNGSVTLPALGTATATKGLGSQSIQFNASAYNSTSKAVVAPKFLLKSEVTGNDTASPNATLNVLASANSSTPAETGLFINSNGTIHFAAGQTFPGGGSSGGSFCIAVGGGFGGGGTTFIAPTFTAPAANGCSTWSGFTKTASTVVLITNGAACLSTDSKVLTLSATSADPAFFGSGTVSDYIQLSRTGTSGTFTTGSDQGQFSGSADQITCTSSLLQLPASHD